MKKMKVASLPQERLEIVRQVIESALDAVDPRKAVRRAVRLQNDRLLVGGLILEPGEIGQIRVVGAGKASQMMARGLLDVLGPRLDKGVIITKHGDMEEPLPERIRVLSGNHPVPGSDSLSSTRALVDSLEGADSSDVLFSLISGGGSALMTLPVEGVSLDDLQALTRLLLACGADIGEINTLRKHLDRVKGGGLARLAAPAKVVTLILSDVIGSPLDVIASGPTVADPTTYRDAIDILRKYQIEDRTPPSILGVLERGARGELVETVKAGDALLERVTNQIVASNLQAAQAAVTKAAGFGFQSRLLTTSLAGEASDAGANLALTLKQARTQASAVKRPVCIIAGGETTVTLHPEHGMGGRNQEMALAAALILDGTPDVAMVTFGTDGEDGPTDAAGAVVTGETLYRARKAGIDAGEFLRRNDAYHFFQTLGDLVITGPTGTNVNDLVFLFVF